MTNSIYIIPSLEDFTKKFAERLTPPYAREDARTDAQISVLNNVRMAYVNGDQLPVPVGTSAEAAVAHLIKQVARETAVVGRTLDAPFSVVGGHDLRDAALVTVQDHINPFQVIEPDNDFNIGVYSLSITDVAPFINDEVKSSLFGSDDFNREKAVVVAITEDEDEDDFIE